MKKPFIVAELSANHLGSLDRAAEIVRQAAAAGADAVKLQTFTPEQMASEGTLVKGGPWAGRRLLELYREAHTPRAWHQPLFELARAYGMVAFSSVFHPDDVDFLETLACPIYKISSFELTDLALIRYAAATGKPLIISNGMAWYHEIAVAVIEADNVLWKQGKKGCDVTLLKCTSAYPAPAADVNLATMVDMRRGALKVGLSDHTLGIAVPVAATALGATVIEKHLTLARADGGPDAAFSLEPHEFADMVRACRDAAAAIGEVRYGPTESEAPMLELRRASGGLRG